MTKPGIKAEPALKGLDIETRQMVLDTVRQLRSRLLTREKILEYDKTHASYAYENLAIFYHVNNNLEKAAEMIEIACDISHNPRQYVRLAMYYDEMERYDEALKFAKERVQGGKTIFQHQNIKLKLFDMFMTVEAARCLSRQVMVHNFEQLKALQPPALEYSMASKIFGTESAFKVANQAVQICGGIGLSQEYVIEKIFRDARMALIQDGANETLALGGAVNL